MPIQPNLRSWLPLPDFGPDFSEALITTPRKTPASFNTLPAETRILIYEYAYTELLKIRSTRPRFPCRGSGSLHSSDKTSISDVQPLPRYKKFPGLGYFKVPNRLLQLHRKLTGNSPENSPEISEDARCQVLPVKSGIDRLMVSRQWFSETIEIFASSVTLEFRSLQAAAVIVEKLPRYLTQSLTAISTRQINYWDRVGKGLCEGHQQHVRDLNRWLPKLRSLCVHIHPVRGACWIDSDIMCRMMEAGTVKPFVLYLMPTAVCDFRGLEKFEIKVDLDWELLFGRGEDCESDAKAWRKYVPHIEACVSSLVTLPKPVELD